MVDSTWAECSSLNLPSRVARIASTEEHLLTSMYITADEACIPTPHRPQPVNYPPGAGGLGAGGLAAGGLGAPAR